MCLSARHGASAFNKELVRRIVDLLVTDDFLAMFCFYSVPILKPLRENLMYVDNSYVLVYSIPD